jgi:Protein of unknown function (DUF3179)
MAGKANYRIAWLILFALVAAVMAIVAIPVWFIKPFSAQTENQVKFSFLLRDWSPTLTIVFSIAAITLAIFIWKKSRWFGKSFLFLPLAAIVFFTWFARQNHFEWMFNPLADTAFVEAKSADFVADDEMVMAVNVNGDAVAFPVRQMAYHHIAQTVVGGAPITATY